MENIKHRFKRGDIIINHWASERNPSRKFIFLSYDANYGRGLYLTSKGRIGTVAFYRRDLDMDIEHFEQVGHAPIDFLFGNMLDKYTMIE